MTGNLTALLPSEGLSFPGWAPVVYAKFLAALVAVPAVVIILHVLTQLVCALHSGGVYLTYRFLASPSRQDSPPTRIPLGTHYGLRCRVWYGPYGIL